MVVRNESDVSLFDDPLDLFLLVLIQHACQVLKVRVPEELYALFLIGALPEQGKWGLHLHFLGLLRGIFVIIDHHVVLPDLIGLVGELAVLVLRHAVEYLFLRVVLVIGLKRVVFTGGELCPRCLMIIAHVRLLHYHLGWVLVGVQVGAVQVRVNEGRVHLEV